MSSFTMKPRRMIRFARKILVQQKLYIRRDFQVALLDDYGVRRKTPFSFSN